MAADQAPSLSSKEVFTAAIQAPSLSSKEVVTAAIQAPSPFSKMEETEVPSVSLIRDIVSSYEDDDLCRTVIRFLRKSQSDLGAAALHELRARLPRHIRARLHRFTLDHDVLRYRANSADIPRIVIPSNDELKHNLLYEFHNTPVSRHLGRDKTLLALSRLFWWKGMTKSVNDYVHRCDVCQRVKASAGDKTPLLSLPIPPNCWSSVSMDFIFGFPKNRQRQTGILVFVCRLSKMVHLAPCREQIGAEEAARLFLEHVFKLHGLPDDLVSDRDPRFTAAFWKHLFQTLGTRLHMSSARHPESDGQTERVNRVVEDILRTFCSIFPTHMGFPSSNC